MLHILILQSYGWQRGGSATLLRNLVLGLDREKFRIHTLFLSNGYLLEEFRRSGILVDYVKSGRLLNILFFLIVVLKIAIFIRTNRIKLIFSNGIRSHIYGGLAALISHIPSVFYWHGLFDDKYPISKIAVSIPTKAIIFNSQFNRDRFILSHSKLAHKSCTVYPGVILNDLTTELSTRYITMPGLLMKWKGQDYFIRAVPRIVEKFPETKFLIVGDIESSSDLSYKKYLQNLVDKLHIENSVLFMGYRDDIYSIIQRSDIIVHSSTSPEPFGMVIAEAGACSKPVVVTDMGGVKEIIEDGMNGILIEWTVENKHHEHS